MTPIFLLMDHFLYRFSMFNEKMKKIYRSLILCEMQNGIPLILAFRLSVQWISVPLEVLKIWNYLPNGPTSTEYD